MQHEVIIGIDAHDGHGAKRRVGGVVTQCDQVVAGEVPMSAHRRCCIVSIGILNAFLSRGK